MFADPWWLLGLLVVAGLVAGYVVLLRRRRRDVVRFTNLALLESVAPKRPGRYRHIPVAALVVALAVLTIALAGPQAQAKVPRNRATVLLVIDVSLSMQSTDVAPSRLVAAQAAATSFADQLPPGVNLGLVSFAGSAAVLVSPTTDRQPVKDAIGSLRLAQATATGEAIFTSIQSIQTFSRSIGGVSGDTPPPAQIVLLSDGKQTIPSAAGADGVPEEQPRGSFTAATEAEKAKIPVSTISFGTAYGTVDIDGKITPVPVDDASLRRIAELSGGRSFTAASEAELRGVYAQLRDQIGYEVRTVDVSRPFLAVGALLLAAGLGLGLVWGRRIP